VPENTASQRIMQKIGMNYQGITDRYYNASLALYTLTKPDYQPDTAFYRMQT
jgi:RimJ/RimL family protein N-acetyltransferase